MEGFRIALLTVCAFALLIASQTACGQKIEYFHTDIFGNVVAISDEDGNVIERRVYEPYGLPQTPIQDGPGFTGHDMDGESGLIYMQQRYYDPQIGQFLSPDPMAVDPATAWNFNRYNYAANNPYRNIDPDGRRCVPLNAASPYCVRRFSYQQFDGRLSGSTRFFGAAAATVEYLANSDLPIVGGVFGPSAEAAQFLHDLSGALYTFNTDLYRQISRGLLTGSNLDARLVRMEQSFVQQHLDKLPAGVRERVIESINGTFKRRGAAIGDAGDRRYNQVLDRVEDTLGRSIDFGNQSDREAIGNALIDDLRKSGGCTPLGSRIPRC